MGCCNSKDEEAKFSVVFSPKNFNLRASKMQSSFNDKETIDKSSVLCKSKTNLHNEMIRSIEHDNDIFTPVKEKIDLIPLPVVKDSNAVFENCLTMNNLIGSISSEAIMRPGYMSNSIATEINLNPKFNEDMLSIYNTSPEKLRNFWSKNEKNIFDSSVANIKLEGSNYIDDNFSILVDRETNPNNLAKTYTAPFVKELIPDIHIRSFDLTQNNSLIKDRDSSHDSETTILGKNNTLPTLKKIAINKIKPITDKNKKKRKAPIDSSRNSNGISISNSNSVKKINTKKDYSKTSNFFKIDSNRKSTRGRVSPSANDENMQMHSRNYVSSNLKNQNKTSYDSQFISNDIDSINRGGKEDDIKTKVLNYTTTNATATETIYSSKHRALRQAPKLSLEKYTQVFGDVVRPPTESNRQIKKSATDISGDITNLKNKICKTQGYNQSFISNNGSSVNDPMETNEKDSACNDSNNSIYKDIQDVVIKS